MELDCFHFEAIMSNAAVNMRVQDFLWSDVFRSWDWSHCVAL